MDFSIKDSMCLIRRVSILGLAGSILLAAQVLSASPWMTNTQTLSAEDVNQGSPTVAWNPTDENYLLVWTHSINAAQSMIFGLFIDDSGAPVGSAFQISDSDTNKQDSARISYDPASDRFLVIWIRENDSYGYDYWGRLIPAAGPSAGLQPFLIAQSGTSGSVNVFDCSVADQPDTSKFFVLWLDNTTGISGLFVPADGSPSSTAVSVVTGAGLFTGVAVAWNEEEEEFLLAYSYSVGGGGYGDDIFATRLSSTGTILGSQISVAVGTSGEYISGVVSCRGEYMVAFQTAEPTLVGTGRGVETVYLSGDGTLGSATVLDYQDLEINQWHDLSYPVIACNQDGGEYLVAWSRLYSETGWSSNGIVGAIFDLDGNIEDTFLIYATADDFDYFEPGLSFGDGGRGLVLWSSERPPDSAFFDLRGRLISNRIFSDGFEDGDTTSWQCP